MLYIYINLKLETIIVDDNSPDNTAKIAEDYFHSIKEKSSHTINVIKRKAKNGLSSAILNGIQESSGNTIVVMDSDFSHPPSIIPKLIDAIKQTRCDIAIASRYVHGGSTDNSIVLRAMSKILNYTFALVLGLKIKDISTNFKIYKRELLSDSKLVCKINQFSKEMFQKYTIIPTAK